MLIAFKLFALELKSSMFLHCAFLNYAAVGKGHTSLLYNKQTETRTEKARCVLYGKHN